MSELQDNLTEILRQKNTYLLPTNIRSGVTILGVTGTLEDADTLTNTVTNLENQVVELTEALENKTAGSIPNIFVQSTEPTSKDGIWLQTNDYTMSGVIAYQNTIPNETWNTTKMAQVTDIPYRFTYSSGTSIGTDIYLFGSTFSSDYRKAYKYNTLTDTYTQLTNIPYDFYRGAVVAIGTDIYLFGSLNNLNNNYKYNTLTDTYTQLTDIPYDFSNGTAVVIGTDIYLFGSYDNNSGSLDNVTKNYKYNTLTDTYTQLTNIPYAFYGGSAVAIGTDIYLFGSASSGDYRKAYKYNTLTDTYTQLTNIPYDFYGGVAVSINSIEEIYLLGSSLNVNKIGIFELKSIEYEDNQIVITQGTPTYLTKILPNNSNLTYYFNDAWIYTDQDGLIQNIPTYYGDGTSWIKFKN